jgi:hypothetical protein
VFSVWSSVSHAIELIANSIEPELDQELCLRSCRNVLSRSSNVVFLPQNLVKVCKQ